MKHSLSVLTPLPDLALLRVAGDDAEGFLQGQFSNDVRKVSDTQAQLASLNSPKGRMLAVACLFRSDSGYLVELHRLVAGTTLARLKMFVLRAKVTLTDVTAEYEHLGLAGTQAAAFLRDANLPVPEVPLGTARAGTTTVVRRHGDVPRFVLRTPAPEAEALKVSLAKRAAPGQPDDWKRLELQAGIPTIYPETADHFVAQMCNLDTLGGLSFDKGCYTGQEVIARVHYRGSVKRRMRLVERAEATLAPGEKIELDDGTGEVVDSVARPGGGCEALVVAHL